ncbi:MAG: hypothetical protein HFE83_01110 [Lachnospiraceae bacterium]|nr:hypothetical protein [Lachnospiraceae bacterium]
MRNKKWFASMTLAAVLAAGMTTTAFADWSKNNDRWYYYNDANGQMVKNDWVQDEGKWYYMDANGVLLMNQMIDDIYYVNENGVMLKEAWVLLRDRWSNEYGWRYFGSNGKAYTDGWKEISGSKYHFTDSVMDTGWFHTDNSTYYLGSSGAMKTGWRKLQAEDEDWGEFWYYFNANGRMEAGGEKKIDGETYLFDGDGKMLTGWVNPSDYTSSDQDNLSTYNVNSLRFYGSGGARAEDWKQKSTPNGEDEGWFYFKAGRAYTTNNGTTKVGKYGMAKIKGETYCFDEQGLMVTGLLELEDGKKFYFEPSSGKMLTGRVVVNDDEHDNEVFYFTTSGALGNKGDGFTGIKSGALYEDGNLVTAEEGMRYQKVKVDGKEYVVNEKGTVKTGGTVKDADGVQYRIEKNSDGSYKITVTE